MSQPHAAVHAIADASDFTLARHSGPTVKHKADLTTGFAVAAGLSLIITVAALLAITQPVRVSIAIVFLFAGPHNWCEARYMLARLPAYAGRLWPFFLLAFSGVMVLAAWFALLPFASGRFSDPLLPLACWNAALVTWVASLVQLRACTNPRFDAGWVWPLAASIVFLQWPSPLLFSVALVYLHPLLAIVILDREVCRSRRGWSLPLRLVICLIPACIVLMWVVARSWPALLPDTAVNRYVLSHVGAELFGGLPRRFFVSVHAFLEFVHYGIWIALIPMAGPKAAPWSIRSIPLARRGRPWHRAVGVTLGCGAFLVLVLWCCFLLDYSTTRHIYFTVAIVHVLAEAPFLVRLL